MTEKTDSERAPAVGESPTEQFKVEDRRHWVERGAEADDGTEAEAAVEPARPSVIEEYRLRAEQAERMLQEYIDAFKKFKVEQEQVRERLQRDVERRVSLEFGSLVGEQLEFLDDLERAMTHVQSSDDPATLVEGLEIACKRFLATLQRHGVEPFSPTGEAFDPNHAEAVRVDVLETPERDGLVTETPRAGYMLNDRVLRAARVAVGRHVKAGS